MQAALRWSLGPEVRVLYQAAMGVFVITVVIGMLNGLKIMTFERQQLLTHVHAGTIGWITLGVFATCAWLFGSVAGVGAPVREARRDGGLRGLAWLAALAVPLYVAAFWTGNLSLRAIFGAPVLLAVIGFLIWVAVRARAVPLTIPRLAVLLALATLTLGSTIGVLVHLQLASGQKFLPDGAIGGHASAQVVGYLVLIGMAIAEWRLMPDTPRLPRLGVTQVVLPFVGGLIVTAGAMFNSREALGGFIPFELAAVGIFLWRFAPILGRTNWLEATPDRHFAIVVPFLVANVILLIVLIGGVVSGAYADFTAIPVWLIFAFDHAMFIGVMSNALFGLVQVASRDRATLWPWADHVLFWGMNFGMIGFVLSLLANARDLERLFTPIMGGSILVAIVVYSARLQTSGRLAAPAATPAE
jgi:hypothetical protein